MVRDILHIHFETTMSKFFLIQVKRLGEPTEIIKIDPNIDSFHLITYLFDGYQMA